MNFPHEVEVVQREIVRMRGDIDEMMTLCMENNNIDDVTEMCEQMFNDAIQAMKAVKDEGLRSVIMMHFLVSLNEWYAMRFRRHVAAEQRGGGD